jgi:hypothetical protein
LLVVVVLELAHRVVEVLVDLELAHLLLLLLEPNTRLPLVVVVLPHIQVAQAEEVRLLLEAPPHLLLHLRG